MSRYHAMFERLAQRQEGAFVPFCVLGDPSPDDSLAIIRALVQGGADALELGIPFSDPVADGPTIQAADVRALEAGTRPSDAWRVLTAVRSEFPDIPIGLLVYVNLVEARGRDDFYSRAAKSGVDSVLIADVPTVEAKPYLDTAARHNIEPVFIATPNAGDHELAQIARFSKGYTYVVSRAGITGTETAAGTTQTPTAKLAALNAPPCLIGFGIAKPEHVRSALRDGAGGAISGSAVVRIIEQHLQNATLRDAALRQFVGEMKAATTRG